MTADVMVQDSRGEVQRLIDTFKIAAEEATRLYSELCGYDAPHFGTCKLDAGPLEYFIWCQISCLLQWL